MFCVFIGNYYFGIIPRTGFNRVSLKKYYLSVDINYLFAPLQRIA